MSEHDPDTVFQFWLGYDESKSTLRQISGCRQCWVEGWLAVFDQHIKDREQLSPYAKGQEAAHLDVLYFCTKHVCGKKPIAIDPVRRLQLGPQSRL